MEQKDSTGIRVQKKDAYETQFLGSSSYDNFH